MQTAWTQNRKNLGWAALRRPAFVSADRRSMRQSCDKQYRKIEVLRRDLGEQFGATRLNDMGYGNDSVQTGHLGSLQETEIYVRWHSGSNGTENSLKVCNAESVLTAFLGLSDNQGMVLWSWEPMSGSLWQCFGAGSYCGAGGTNIAALGPHLKRMNPCDVT